MYQIRRTTQFKKDIKRVLQRGKDFEQLLSVVKHLAEEHVRMRDVDDYLHMR